MIHLDNLKKALLFFIILMGLPGFDVCLACCRRNIACCPKNIALADPAAANMHLNPPPRPSTTLNEKVVYLHRIFFGSIRSHGLKFHKFQRFF